MVGSYGAVPVCEELTYRGLTVLEVDGSASLWAKDFYPRLVRWRHARRPYSWLARHWPSLFARDFVVLCRKEGRAS